MLGLISAMPIEMELLAAELEGSKTEKIGGAVFHVGTLWGHAAVLAVCGPGKVNAALCAQAMILHYQPEAVINLGVAGSLSEKLDIGNIVIGTFAVQHDMDTTPLGDPPGFISGIQLVRLPLSEVLSSKLLTALASLDDIHGMPGGIATGDQFVHDGNRRTSLRDGFDAICCEMEGGAVAHVCYVNDTPCAIVRAISDQADGSSDIDYPNFVKMAAHNSVRLIKQFLTEK